MAGQHIEREARWAQTGLSPVQRDERVWELKHKGYSYAQIGKHLGMSKSACKYIFDRLNGHPRQTASIDMCQECWRDFPKRELGAAGLCSECAGTAGEKPPPAETW
jgi:hypothetical protein